MITKFTGSSASFRTEERNESNDLLSNCVQSNTKYFLITLHQSKPHRNAERSTFLRKLVLLPAVSLELSLASFISD